MSRAHMLVRFPDGSVREGLYEGSSDVYLPWLTSGDSWAELYGLIRGRPTETTTPRDWDEAPVGEVVEVDVYSGYGYGWVVPGRAAPNVLVFPRTWDDTYDNGIEFTWDGQAPDSYPDWVRAYYDSKDSTD